MVVSGTPPRTFVGRPSPRACLSSVLWRPPSFPSPPASWAALPLPSTTKCQGPRAQKFEPLLSQTARVKAFANHLYKEKAWLSKLYISTHIQKHKHLRSPWGFYSGEVMKHTEENHWRRSQGHRGGERWVWDGRLLGPTSAYTTSCLSAKMVGSSQEFFPGGWVLILLNALVFFVSLLYLRKKEMS